MSAHPAIQTSGLQKSYGRVRALQGVDLDVAPGEIYGFLGPNGAGKTTTIRCLLDLIRPDAGRVSILGLNPQADPVGVRRQVSYLPGELRLDESLSAGRLLRYLAALRRHGVNWGYVETLAERLDLDLNATIRNMSKGNKQKVGVVQALMARPALLLLDEPTAGLDPLMQQEVYRLLREARDHGSTVFFSSHIISEVEAIAERVAIIRSGRIVQVAEPAALLEMALRRVRIRFGGDVALDALQDVPGVTLLHRNGSRALLSVEGEMDALVKALARYPVLDFETERPTLEELFLAYYEEREGTDVG